MFKQMAQRVNFGMDFKLNSPVEVVQSAEEGQLFSIDFDRCVEFIFGFLSSSGRSDESVGGVL